MRKPITGVVVIGNPRRKINTRERHRVIASIMGDRDRPGAVIDGLPFTKRLAVCN